MRFATIFVFASSLALGALAGPLSRRQSSSNGTYHNPIKPGGGADPWVIEHGGAYYLTYTTGGDVQVTRSDSLVSWNATGSVVYTPADGLKDIWAPELHFLNGSFYIYVAMDHGDNADHRMYVLKGTNDSDPTAPFDLVGKIASEDDHWAIDGTVLTQADGALYFVWSGWENATVTTEQNLYIAPMSSPANISGPRVLLHEPLLDWQRSNNQGVNEGPTALVHGNKTYLVYSAAGSWGPDYSLALMSINSNADPLVKSNWAAKDDGPVFARTADVFGPGHASFAAASDGTPYVVYHATQTVDGGWENRSIRAQSFGWGADGAPAFPKPVGFGVELPLPGTTANGTANASKTEAATGNASATANASATGSAAAEAAVIAGWLRASVAAAVTVALFC